MHQSPRAAWVAVACLLAVALGACSRSPVPATGAATAPGTSAGQDATPGSTTPGGGDDLAQRGKDLLAPCKAPLTPDIPDGTSATTEQMLTGQRAFKAYDADTVTYTRCVDGAIEQLTKEAAGHATEADLRDLSALGVRLHDAAVEQEQVAADNFNAQVRTFKARHH